MVPNNRSTWRHNSIDCNLNTECHELLKFRYKHASSNLQNVIHICFAIKIHVCDVNTLIKSKRLLKLFKKSWYEISSKYTHRFSKWNVPTDRHISHIYQSMHRNRKARNVPNLTSRVTTLAQTVGWRPIKLWRITTAQRPKITIFQGEGV